MERWTGRVAVVTGASAGIGAAIVKELVLKGMKVVGLARRVDRVEAMRAELKTAPGELHPLKCDVTQEDDILAAFTWVTKNLGGVDVLVNNAGITRLGSNLVSSPTKQWSDMIQTNLLGLSVCTREAVKSMRERGVDDGHIIHINSTTGHKIMSHPGVGMYSATKYGVTALTEALRLELVALKSRIRVTSISPGAVRTEILQAAGVSVEAMKTFAADMPFLQAKDIADAVVYVVGAPDHVQIHELTIKPVGEKM